MRIPKRWSPTPTGVRCIRLALCITYRRSCVVRKEAPLGIRSHSISEGRIAFPLQVARRGPVLLKQKNPITVVNEKLFCSFLQPLLPVRCPFKFYVSLRSIPLSPWSVSFLRRGMPQRTAPRLSCPFSALPLSRLSSFLGAARFSWRVVVR